MIFMAVAPAPLLLVDLRAGLAVGEVGQDEEKQTAGKPTAFAKQGLECGDSSPLFFSFGVKQTAHHRKQNKAAMNRRTPKSRATPCETSLS